MSTSAEPVCDLVLPCLDEAPALADLLPRIPAQFAVIVADNGSTDDTAAVAQGNIANRLDVELLLVAVQQQVAVRKTLEEVNQEDVVASSGQPAGLP